MYLYNYIFKERHFEMSKNLPARDAGGVYCRMLTSAPSVSPLLPYAADGKT